MNNAEATHVDYPHFPGTLFDCTACEAVCHCDPDDIITLGDERIMCVHCEIKFENMTPDEIDDYFGVDSIFYMD